MEQSLLDLLNLPEVQHIIYDRPPLALTLCQVRFTRVLSIGDQAYVASFQDAIREHYPVVQRGTEVQFVVAPAEGAVQGQAQSQHWRFSDGRDEWTVVLADDFLAIETRAYNDFQEFLGRLEVILAALIKYIRPSQLIRIGLRYIDEIRQDDSNLEWSDIIRQEMLGSLAISEFSSNIHLSVQEFLLRYSHNRGINIHHGLFPTGTTVAPPTGQLAPNTPFYLLDIDVFRDFPVAAKQAMNPDDICRHVAEYNRVVYRLFRWFVLDQYLQTLGVRRVDNR
ncbi:TIGR04255 family protein [Chloroflexales bacterium ZM16-3]|nr:TIGR04255 family protein [Chloroflexales bacterium ZM16-3]